VGSRNEVRQEYFGTQVTSQQKLTAKTQLAQNKTYSVSPSFGIQNQSDLSYKQSVQNDTLIVKNTNSHIVDEARFEDDFTKTR
jgi:hypothetical protein